QRVMLAVNKAEGMRHAAPLAEFHELGLGEPRPISASHGDGVVELIEDAVSYLDDEVEEDVAEEPVDAWDDAEPEVDPEADLADDEAPRDEPRHRIKLAIVGRPNVGKSTLINALIGEERVIAFDMPGTTRDAIEI